MKKVKVILAGGFLGAGKTTTIVKLASILEKRNIKVGIITNDQGIKLVDGSYVKNSGLSGIDITGGCFCCKFDDLIRGMDRLISEYDPDILIAEPVGSCTDLVSTVFLPLIKHYPDKFLLAPLSVIVDSKLLEKDFPFSENIQYLFEKQIEEANILLVNKIDLIENRCAFIDKVREKYGDKDVIPICGLTGEGLDLWVENVMQSAASFRPLKEIDYNRYGNAESLLGWYNSSVSILATMLFDPNDMVQEFLENTVASIKNAVGVIAHLKIIAETAGGIIKASIVRNSDQVVFDRSAYDLTLKMELLINARVEMNHERLNELINNQFFSCCEKFNIKAKIVYEECFAPSFPNPTYKGE